MTQNNSNRIKLVATDLDGTFLNNQSTISDENLKTLNSLGEKGILRVVATGRNLKKTKDVIAAEVPFDYVVFSSGAGVYDWKNRKMIFQQNMNKQIVEQLSAFLIRRDLNFHLFKPVPDNFMCWYHRGSVPCDEFEKYFDFHQAHSEVFPSDRMLDSDACQFLVVFPNDPERFFNFWNEVKTLFPDVKVIRTSSPLDTGYIWMEIFHQSVSKGNGVKFVCETLNIGQEYTFGIGNDFNDLDLLEFTQFSYMVANGPQELKDRFRAAKSNEENAFANAIEKYL